MKDTTGRIGLITGANKRIGYEVARQLAVSGCTIPIGARSQILSDPAGQQSLPEHESIGSAFCDRI